MLKIIGRGTSSNVMKALWTCAELGLEPEREDLGGPFGGNDSPEFLAMNPNGLVPVMVDGDFVLWESNSIVRYLGAVYGKDGFRPDDAKARAIAEKWMDWQISAMSPAMQPVFRGLVRTPPEKRDMDAINAARDRLGTCFGMVEATLAETEFLAGDTFTMGDIPVGIATYRWFNMPIEREDYPNLQRWYDALCTRPGYQEHIMRGLE